MLDTLRRFDMKIYCIIQAFDKLIEVIRDIEPNTHINYPGWVRFTVRYFVDPVFRGSTGIIGDGYRYFLYKTVVDGLEALELEQQKPEGRSDFDEIKALILDILTNGRGILI